MRKIKYRVLFSSFAFLLLSVIFLSVSTSVLAAKPTPTPTRIPTPTRTPKPTPDDHITHEVKKGNIIIWPRYYWCTLAGCGTPTENTNNAIVSIKDGLSWLNAHAQIAPDPSGILLLGASWGGGISMNLANS